MKYIVIYISVFIGIYACTPSSRQVDKVITEDNIVSPQNHKTPITEALNVDKINIYDSILICINRMSDTVFHLYNKYDFSYIGSFGVIGQGPNDFQFPFFLKQEQCDSILLYDVSLASFKSIHINDIKTHNTGNIHSVKMPKSLIRSPNLIQVNDSCFIGNIDNGEGLFFIYSQEQDEQKWIEFPDLLQQPEQNFTVMNMNRITFNAQQDRIASAMTYYNLLFLYDLKGNLKKTIQLGEEKIEPFIPDEYGMNPENLICCRDLASTDEAIYILMQHDVKEKDFDNSDNNPSRIVMLDWDLNYLKTYQLPHYSLSFYVDESQDRIIYTVLNEEGGTDICYIIMDT